MSRNTQCIKKRGFFYDLHYTFGKFMPLERYTSSIVNSSAVL